MARLRLLCSSVVLISRPLTLADMDLLDIFYQSLSDASDQIQALDAVPVAFWKMLVNSFFEKK